MRGSPGDRRRHREKRHRKSCEGKQRHPDRDSAVRHATSLQRKLGARVNAYRCSICGSWHVGHRPKR